MAKIATTMQQCERETARRVAMEKTVKNLNGQLDFEKKHLITRHATELQKLRDEWEEERNTLLSIIQKECNSVFDRKMSSLARHIPRPSTTPIATATATSAFFSESLTVDTDTYPVSSSPRRKSYASRSPPLISPLSLSDFGQFLRETEELVQSIM
jgi:hypothetical protein